VPAELRSVAVEARPLDAYRDLLEGHAWEEFTQAMRDLARGVQGRVVWNLNSTPRGGGVAELLHTLIPYERGAGIDARWVAIEGSAGFFAFTKRLHRLLHGDAPDGDEVSDREHFEYEANLGANWLLLKRLIQPRDVVILHDPQVAGLVPVLAEHGCRVIWRCHVGVDRPNHAARQAWDFLLPCVRLADAVVFSRGAYVWEGLEAAKTEVIAPCIDAFSAKNRELDAQTQRAALQKVGLPAAESPLVVQVSRWDRLKDPIGVLEGFTEHVAPQAEGALVLAGPEIRGVSDDPEEPQVWQELEARWRRLPESMRGRVRLAQLPMSDETENATLVNALQRQAQVVVQKSLAEGFGLTVAEAMWKRRAVVATRVGGIGDQIEDGRSGLLIDEPRDLAAFGAAVVRLLREPETAERLGAEAQRTVSHHFLAPRHLVQQARLVLRLVV
jgi:trehalose synthase